MNRFVQWTGERFVPWIDVKNPDIYFEHYNRYYFALQYVGGKKVLDIASGEGYGSKILSSKALSITGIDIDQDAVKHASENYVSENLSFMVSDATDIAIKEDKSFDVIVCFEALEHISDQDKLLLEVKRLLKDDGIFIVSTPNKAVYTDKLHNANPYHVSELYFNELRQLLSRYFKSSGYWSQNIYPTSVIRPVGKNKGYLIDIGVKYNHGLQTVDPSEKEAEYYIAVVSDLPLDQNDLFVNLTDIYRSLTKQYDDRLSELYQKLQQKEDTLTLYTKTHDFDLNLINEQAKKIDDLERLNNNLKEKEQIVQQLRESLVEDKELLIEQFQEERRFLNRQLEKERTDFKQILTSRFFYNDKASIRYRLKNMRYAIVKSLLFMLKLAYKLLPLPKSAKRSFRDMFFTTFSPVLKRTNIYAQWLSKRQFDVALKKTAMVEENKNRPGTLPVANSDYIGKSDLKIKLTEDDVKMLAFYLPQFHPIPENSKWWGNGFTEWTNVSKGFPQFEGHYQPHLPDELGFYDLRLKENIKKQMDLAKMYGIYGFCIYYYWFNGKKLLETPLDMIYENKELNLPFCLCWANENWTRRWDGGNNEVLIDQKYDGNYAFEFIKEMSKYLEDKRYIRINGKPVIVIYRPIEIPDLADCVSTWREYCRQNGIGEIAVWAVKIRDESVDCSQKILDAFVEFPPHSLCDYCLHDITKEQKLLNKNFNGLVLDYRRYVDDKHYLHYTDYKLYKGICLEWDNTARRGGGATVFHNFSIQAYKKWLNNLLDFTKRKFKNEDKVVFINAWNEWGEGTHLEPDKKYGFAYLDATRQCLLDSRRVAKRIIYVTHDCSFNGAQILSLNIVKQLKEVFGYDVILFMLSGGNLSEEFEKYCFKIINVEKDIVDDNHLRTVIAQTRCDKAICNTVVTGNFVKTLSESGVECLSLIHEMEHVIKQYNCEDKLESINKYAKYMVFASDVVKNSVEKILKLDQSKIIIKPQGIYSPNMSVGHEIQVKKEVREQLNLPENAKLVFGAGYAYYRKGFDLFTDTLIKLCAEHPDCYFIWAGDADQPYVSNCVKKVKKAGFGSKLILLPAQKDIGRYFTASDLYLLTSREDPFPSVALEALNAGIPIVGFENAGGFSDVVSENTGALVELENTDQMALAVSKILYTEDYGKYYENCRREAEKYDFIDYLYDLLGLLGHDYKKVSVVIPNYNYERYLKGRIESVFNQSYPVYEVIFLDDASKDNSLEIAEEYKKRYPLSFRIIKNIQNSGSVFKQWQKGISLAKGDYIWIAEADDLCQPEFLQNNIENFNKDDQIVLSYTQSKQMADDGSILADNYLNYTQDVNEEKFRNDYITDGLEEIKTSLCIKNTIPNVSAVVFKKSDSLSLLDMSTMYKVAGDWLFYINYLGVGGKIAFCSKPLNYHRRHSQSATSELDNKQHFDEIIDIQNMVIKKYEIPKETVKKTISYRNSVKDYLHLL